MPVLDRSRRRGLILTCALIIAACLPGVASAAQPAAAGTVRFARPAESSFDAYTRAPTQQQQTFMRTHYWRMRAYSPYFDSRLSWYANAWVYQDAYALYPTSAEVTKHPDWILRDPSGTKLWVQYGCSNGSCTQYAADIGNPAFRAWWIAAAKAKLAAGYRGLFIDDVNMAERISNGNGVFTEPVDPRTGVRLDETTWQRYMAAFMREVRAALPGVEIVHNSVWTVGDGSTDLRAQLDAADYVELERGFNDAGIVGGTGKFGFQTLASFIDRRHAAGRGVILDTHASTPAARLYGLATYFLVSSGIDAIGNDSYSAPDTWWSGYNTNLGAPTGPRYKSAGVWRRDFARGVVLVNEPGAASQTVTVGSGWRNLDGKATTSVTLGAASGAVLVRDGAVAAATSTTVATASVTGSIPAVAPGPSPTTAAATTSAAQPAAVARKPRTSTRTTTAAHGGGVRVLGRVRGATSGRVRIGLQRRRGARWTTVLTAGVDVAPNGRYAHDVAKLRAGAYRVQVAYLGSPTARPSRSRCHQFAV